MLMDLLVIYLVGLALSTGFGIKTAGEKRIILGIMGWVVIAGLLGYAKLNANSQFMQIQGLKTAYIPLLMMIPMALYRHPRVIWQTIKQDFGVILVIFLVMGVYSSIMPMRPSYAYSEQLRRISATSLVTQYQGAMVVIREPFVNYGAELIESYLKEFHETEYDKTYQNLWGLGFMALGWGLIRDVARLKYKAKVSWRELISLGIFLITLSLGFVRFTDGVGVIMLFGAWWLAREMAKDKQIVVLGIILMGCLMIQRNATGLWIIPSLLLFHPKETLWGVGIMTLLNPWLVGGHK